MPNENLTGRSFAELEKLSAQLAESERLLQSLQKYQNIQARNIDISGNSIADVTQDISALTAGIALLRAKRTEKLASFEAFLELISDPRVQTYLRLHYAKGLSWDAVALATGAKSGGVARAMVEDAFAEVRIRQKEKGAAVPKIQLSDFAKMSAELAKKSLMLETVRRFIASEENDIGVTPADAMELESEVAQLTAKREIHLPEVLTFIDSISIPAIQTYARAHYLRGMTWDEVAALTSTASGNAARTRVTRYLKYRHTLERG